MIVFWVERIGRQPTAVTSCGDEKWGDWRPHLAMILSSSTAKSELDKKSIVTLGDTLVARGYLVSAHFCYLVAQVEFGEYANKTSKLVLLSSSAAQPFDAFATSEAIQCTEVYEYVRQLAVPDFVIRSLQAYKYLYATRLAEHGRAAEALQYCEAVGTVLVRNPSDYAPHLLARVHQLGAMLKFHDVQYQTETDGATHADPEWLKALAALVSQGETPSLTLASSSAADVAVYDQQQVTAPYQTHTEEAAAPATALEKPVFYDQQGAVVSQPPAQEQSPLASYSDYQAAPQQAQEPQYYGQDQSLTYLQQQQPWNDRQDASAYAQTAPAGDDQQQNRPVGGFAADSAYPSASNYPPTPGFGSSYNSYSTPGQLNGQDQQQQQQQQQPASLGYYGQRNDDYWSNSNSLVSKFAMFLVENRDGHFFLKKVT